MKTIWKYELDITDAQEIQVPRRARVIAAGMMNDRLCVWAEVNPNFKTEGRWIYVYGTGNPFSGGDFIGTVITPPFVWHVYEERM